jgi:hypothetical protein
MQRNAFFNTSFHSPSFIYILQRASVPVFSRPGDLAVRPVVWAGEQPAARGRRNQAHGWGRLVRHLPLFEIPAQVAAASPFSSRWKYLLDSGL